MTRAGRSPARQRRSDRPIGPVTPDVINGRAGAPLVVRELSEQELLDEWKHILLATADEQQSDEIVISGERAAAIIALTLRYGELRRDLAWLNHATRPLPPEMRARYKEEWQAHLNELHGWKRRRHAWSLLLAGIKLGLAFRAGSIWRPPWRP